MTITNILKATVPIVGYLCTCTVVFELKMLQVLRLLIEVNGSATAATKERPIVTGEGHAGTVNVNCKLPFVTT